MYLFRHAGLEEPAPSLIWGHPEGFERTGFRLEFTPLQNGAGMTLLIEDGIYGQSLINK